MIERAILQQASDRDGVTREYHRPQEVRTTAQRVQAWRHGGQEACSNCRSGAATVLRQGRAFCPVCRAQLEERFAPIASGRGVLPFREARAETADGIVGLFIVFNSRSEDLGGFTEIIKPSAVDRSLSGNHDIRGLWSHDTSLVIGRRSAGTLTVEKQRNGLYAEIYPPSWAAAHVETVTRGDVSQASFGFITHEDEWHISNDEVLREILDAEIVELSGVSFPAYRATKIRVESLRARRQREIETLMRMVR
jgi:HK97 family phage prohead protease